MHYKAPFKNQLKKAPKNQSHASVPLNDSGNRQKVILEKSFNKSSGFQVGFFLKLFPKIFTYSQTISLESQTFEGPKRSKKWDQS